MKKQDPISKKYFEFEELLRKSVVAELTQPHTKMGMMAHEFNSHGMSRPIFNAFLAQFLNEGLLAKGGFSSKGRGTMYVLGQKS